MGRNFYLRIAVNNIKRNQKKFAPYFIAATIMVCIYFMVVMIAYTPGLANTPGEVYMRMLFKIGINTLNILIAIFLLYINSFLIKQRKKEFGLYGILGLEKRHVGYVMAWENLCMNGGALLFGIIGGCVFGWLVFMLLLKSIRVTGDTYFALPVQAFTYTVAYFIILFVVVLVLNSIQVQIAKPIDLLKSDHVGEKKPRFLIPITVIGLVLLVYAYYTALTVTNPILALTEFFKAVVMVIIATFLLFASGSIAFLQLMKKNKKFYYRPDNFISISGMLHRMKQNASGLAAICILSTMVLVTVSTCFALYLGQEDTLSIMNKDDVVFKLEGESKESARQLEQLVQDTALQFNMEIEQGYQYYSFDGILVYENQQFAVADKGIDYNSGKDYLSLDIMSLDNFNKLTNRNEELKENQLILLSNAGEYENIKDFTVAANTYEIVEKISDTVLTNGKNRKAMEEVFFIVKDYDTLNQLVQSMNSKYFKDSTKLVFNLHGNQQSGYEFSYQMKDRAKQIPEYKSINSIYINRADGYSTYGGLLFMGAFFTIVFLCATVLIIYFKQISEGYEDKDRYEMLQKVGMDDREVKKTINKQTMLVFFLPLIGALLHLSMASHMIIKLIQLFNMYNTGLTIFCMVCTGLVFAVVYLLVYRLTAKTYCNIVKW